MWTVCVTPTQAHLKIQKTEFYLNTPLQLNGSAARPGARRGVYCKAVAAPVSPTELKPPANLHGFELMREEYVAEYDAKVFMFRHEKTGAEVMSLSNDDENKTFGVTFRTPPANSTGIPHILEHSVLCGSRKYPIKEPFVELIKGPPNCVHHHRDPNP